MRWTEITASGVKYWECVFVNVPFKVVVELTPQAVTSTLYLVWNHTTHIQLAKKECESIEQAKVEVEAFVLDHLALYSAQVHRECLNANVMTWRKLKEQLEQIPEDQLDEAIRVLDSDGDWIGEPEIIKASQDMYKDSELGYDCTLSHGTDDELVVVNSHYYLSIEL